MTVKALKDMTRGERISVAMRKRWRDKKREQSTKGVAVKKTDAATEFAAALSSNPMAATKVTKRKYATRKVTPVIKPVLSLRPGKIIVAIMDVTTFTEAMKNL